MLVYMLPDISAHPYIHNLPWIICELYWISPVAQAPLQSYISCHLKVSASQMVKKKIFKKNHAGMLKTSFVFFFFFVDLDLFGGRRCDDKFCADFYFNHTQHVAGAIIFIFIHSCCTYCTIHSVHISYSRLIFFLCGNSIYYYFYYDCY